MTTFDTYPAMAAMPVIPPNIASQLPQLNFGFEELKERMARFTVTFDDFIEKRREKMLADKNAYVREIAEVKGIKNHAKTRIKSFRNVFVSMIS